MHYIHIYAQLYCTVLALYLCVCEGAPSVSSYPSFCDAGTMRFCALLCALWSSSSCLLQVPLLVTPAAARRMFGGLCCLDRRGVRGLTPNSNMQTDPCRSFLGDSRCTPYAPQTHPGSIPDPSRSSFDWKTCERKHLAGSGKIRKDLEGSGVPSGRTRSHQEQICRDLPV